jgi:exopolyphosphatase/guanosine-5'-triphosphate,3'-diphosphate pyrophosphatase
MIWKSIKAPVVDRRSTLNRRGRELYVDHLRAVLRLAESCSYERVHTHQVTRLALKLFDELKPLHRLGAAERFYLNCAALLHDIGRVERDKGHHKASLKIVMKSPLLPFDTQTRRIIGSIARYHTKAPPKKKHDHFDQLNHEHRRVVVQLSAILRLADALDRTHRTLVHQLWCEISNRRIIVWCVLRGDNKHHRLLYRRASEKGRLLRKVFKRELVIEGVPLDNLD